MTMPYRVSVTGKDNSVNVKIDPQPIATKEEYALVVTGRFQKVLLNPGIRNTLLGRSKLRKELLDVLRDFHAQGLIKPKEKDEGEQPV